MEIGTTAGLVWKHLSKNGSMTTAKLARETGESQRGIDRAIGWLAREGKVRLWKERRAEWISLVEGKP